MSKADQLAKALRERYGNPSPHTDAIILGYFTGFLGVLEQSDEKLMEALNFHLQDTLKYNKKQGIA